MSNTLRHATVNKWWRALHGSMTYTNSRFNRWAFIYGLLSGIPICCAEWWALKGGQHRAARVSSGHRCYIPCPNCRKTGYAVPLYREKDRAWHWMNKPRIKGKMAYYSSTGFGTRVAAMRAEPKFRRMHNA